jgi:hypothetical protein
MFFPDPLNGIPYTYVQSLSHPRKRAATPAEYMILLSTLCTWAVFTADPTVILRSAIRIIAVWSGKRGIGRSFLGNGLQEIITGYKTTSPAIDTDRNRSPYPDKDTGIA